MDIIIDTTGQADLVSKDRLLDSDDDDITLENIVPEPDKQPGSTIKKTKKEKEKEEAKKKKKKKKLQLINYECAKKKSIMDIDLNEFEMEMGWTSKRRKVKQTMTNVVKIIKEVSPVEKALEKSVIKPGFEQVETVPREGGNVKKLRALKQKEREKTKGKKWFNMPATEMTDEIKHDLELIQMRSVLDPKHFYKKNDMKVLPKYFQIGKVVDSPVDFYNGRMTKKERKRTIVDELMADAEFSKYNKRKYKEIVDEKRKLHYKAHKHAKKLKKKN